MSGTALGAEIQALRDKIDNQYIPAAEAACCEGGPMACERDEIPADWILQGERELKTSRQPRFVGDSLLATPSTTPAEQLLEQAQATVRDRRRTYGPPTEHFRKTVGMLNAAFADVLRRPLTMADWAIIMTIDKIARHQGPNKSTDTPIDVAGYAACLAECEAATPATE